MFAGSVLNNDRSGLQDEVIGVKRFARYEVILAGILSFSLILITVAIFPLAQTKLEAMPAFLPAWSTAVILVQGLTAYLLGVQYRYNQQALYGALAGAFGYVAIIALVQSLVFPGGFSADGLLGSHPQSVIWLWVGWHLGFPLLVLAALFLSSQTGAKWLGKQIGRAPMVALAGGPVLSLVLSGLSIFNEPLLPEMIVNGSYAKLSHSWAAASIICALVIATILGCVRVGRLRNSLSLWLIVVLVADLCDVGLGLRAASQFSLGWYTGRMLSLFSACVIFCLLLTNLAQLYRRVVQANAILLERAVRDGLTGIYNRRFFDDQLERELRRSIRAREPLSVLMLDVDEFKRFNDELGHQAGDDCLIQIARGIEASIRRPADFVARYGGEEFAVVLSATDGAGAVQVAENIRLAILDLAISRQTGGEDYVSVSLGVATFDPQTDPLDVRQLVHEADTALYYSKHHGRNRVTSYSEAAITAVDAS